MYWSKNMKRLFNAVLIFIMFVVPFTAFAGDNEKIEAPTLEYVEFNNASIVGEFSPSLFEYRIMLDESGKTPTLAKYSITQGANIIFTDSFSGTAKGINIEVKKNNVSSNYFFEYIYPDSLEVDRSNNYLKELGCELGEVYPALNQKDTSYSLYIPSDMTELKISAVAESVGAVCEVPGLIKLNSGQAPDIKVNVRAVDSSVRVYTFSIKRLDKTSQEILDELEDDDLFALVENEIFHKRPEFKIIVLSVVGGLLILAVFVSVLKRIAIRPNDDDEVDFFDYYEDDDKEKD